MEPKFDDVRIAGRYHNPPYGLFAVVTFMPRVRGKQQAEYQSVIRRSEGEIVGSMLTLSARQKTRRELAVPEKKRHASHGLRNQLTEAKFRGRYALVERLPSEEDFGSGI